MRAPEAFQRLEVVSRDSLREGTRRSVVRLQALTSRIAVVARPLSSILTNRTQITSLQIYLGREPIEVWRSRESICKPAHLSERTRSPLSL